MAKQDMGKSMGNRECDWIRSRIPLWIASDDGTGRPAAHCEGGDLSARELYHVERHLANCATCREYRVSMNQALGALATAATLVPAMSEGPSLWPVLERRIAGRLTGTDSLWPGAVRNLDDRSDWPWNDLDDVRPLRQAWAQDSDGQGMIGQNGPAKKHGRMASLILRLSVAAAVIGGLVEISIVSRQWKNARATIQANSVPLADPLTLPAATVSPPVEISERDSGDVPANQVAEAEPPRPVEVLPPALDAVAAPKSPPNTRYGFDLEHGTPMPPQSREAKPVY